MDNKTDIVFENVRFCYGEVCAVNSMNFSLASKKMTVLVGPNGGGKSTLIKLLAGLLKPEEGSIACRKGLEVGYVSQIFSFEASFPLTVEELVLQGTLPKAIRPFRRYTAQQKEKAAEAILRVGLHGFERRGISQLSGGQLKRAVIARAFASDANMIALDEPDASLDVDAARELYSILSFLKAEKTIVIASHHIDAVLDIADKAIYVNKTTIEFASPQELKGVLNGGILL
jgi:zinc transport system ATP-binding protein